LTSTYRRALPYYQFREERNVKKELPYRPDADLAFCFDFNVSPGTATVIQEHRIKGNRTNETVSCIIGEVFIPRNSNTPAVCRRLLRDWGDHTGRVICYGDATGGARGTAKTRGSDWEIIRDELRPSFGDNLSFRVKRANPPERARVNAVNTRLASTDGRVRLLVGANCKHTINDFEGVRTLEGGSGEIDKKSDPMLSHLTDGVGYYVDREFPIGGRSTKKLVEDIPL